MDPKLLFDLFNRSNLKGAFWFWISGLYLQNLTYYNFVQFFKKVTKYLGNDEIRRKYGICLINI